MTLNTCINRLIHCNSTYLIHCKSSPINALFQEALWIDRRTDGWTDRPSYKDARTHLRTIIGTTFLKALGFVRLALGFVRLFWKRVFLLLIFWIKICFFHQIKENTNSEDIQGFGGRMWLKCVKFLTCSYGLHIGYMLLLLSYKT